MNSLPQPPDLSENCPYIPSDPFKDANFANKESTLNVARVDKFIIVLNIPNCLQQILKTQNRYCGGSFNLNRLQFSIYGYTVPKVSIPKLDVAWGGQTLQFSSFAREPYDPLTINFTVDNRYDNYYILWSWLNMINDWKTGQFNNGNTDTKGTEPQYATTFTIIALNEYDEHTAKWNYYGSFPTELGEIKTDQRNTDKSELESTFTFAFSQLQMLLE